MCCKTYRKFWKQGRKDIKPRWNTGFILDCSKVLFWVLGKFSISQFIVYRKKYKKGYFPSKLSWTVDLYITSWVVFELALLSALIIEPNIAVFSAFRIISIALVLYRLFEIFQIWVSHFILPDWEPISVHRSLILVFIGYFEIIISYTLLAFISKDSFEGIACLQQAFYYSIRNAITIGSNVNPITPVGLAIYASQIMFVLLFLTSVVSRVISRRENA